MPNASTAHRTIEERLLAIEDRLEILNLIAKPSAERRQAAPTISPVRSIPRMA